jgi:hypothetical protein
MPMKNSSDSIPDKKPNNSQRNKNRALLAVLLLVVVLLYSIAVMRIGMLGDAMQIKNDTNIVSAE